MVQDASTSAVLMTHADGVLHIELNRPERLNALDAESVERIRDGLIAVGDEPSVGAVVISGRGRAFCAGRDLRTLHAIPDRRSMSVQDRAAARRDEHDRLLNGFTVVTLLRTVGVPCIAALHGAVAGAGLGIALACDLRVVATDTTLVSAYGRIGLPGDWGVTRMLPRVVGDALARRMLFTGHRPTVAELEAVGFATAVVRPDEATAAALRQGVSLAAGPRIAHHHMKALLRDDRLVEHLEKEVHATMLCQETDAHRVALQELLT
ncbi:enoyl-CoA hydratase/isomerase family protein [Euzebya rosea]|uniref:enoyl-CoA hydratase/isomerase family protein n=1 Tax=Euzebya rosea TaxID=2052804 RepID=UPI000D3EB321|nr:enoyl-CoA hydratase/isomerase family protein [Euzebya rosea]